MLLFLVLVGLCSSCLLSGSCSRCSDVACTGRVGFCLLVVPKLTLKGFAFLFSFGGVLSFGLSAKVLGVAVCC